MAKLNLKTMKKSTKDHIITFAMVIVVYIIVQTMITTGNMSSLMQGLLVPMCTYSIVAIGLNLCVCLLYTSEATFVKEAANQGFEVVAEEAFTADSKTDFSTQLQKAQSEGCLLYTSRQLNTCHHLQRSNVWE